LFLYTFVSAKNKGVSDQHAGSRYPQPRVTSDSASGAATEGITLGSTLHIAYIEERFLALPAYGRQARNDGRHWHRLSIQT